MASAIRMSPVTLAFSDVKTEALFRTELASNTVGVGVLTNAAALVSVAAGLFLSAGRPCSFLWPRIVAFAMAATGMASNVCIGRLGRPEFEHQLLVAVGVMVMFCGSAAFVVCGMLTSLPSDCPAVVDTNEVYFIGGTFPLVIIAMHVLAFPFRARLAIHASVLAAAIALAFVPKFYPREIVHGLWAICPIVLIFEAIGYTLHRVSRLQFAEKQQLAAAREAEQAVMESERRALTSRLEQLIGEKDFATYEALIARRRLEQPGSVSSGDGAADGGWGPDRGGGGRGDGGVGSAGTASTTGDEIEAIMRAHHDLAAGEGAPPGDRVAGGVAGGVAAGGHEQHLDGLYLDPNDLRPALSAAVGIPHVASLEQASSPLFRARQRALWRTLEDAGLLPQMGDARGARGGEEGGCPTYSESDCYSDHSRGIGNEHELSRQFECLSKKDV